VEYADYQLFIHSVIFIDCVVTVFVFVYNDSFWSHDIYCSVHPGEGSSSVALLKGCLRVFPDPM